MKKKQIDSSPIGKSEELSQEENDFCFRIKLTLMRTITEANNKEIYAFIRHLLRDDEKEAQ